MVNKVILVGRLGKKPEEFNNPHGGIICSAYLITNKKYKNKAGDMIESSMGHSLVLYGKSAETLYKYGRKGGMLYVEGELQEKRFTGKDGVSRAKIEIRVNNWQFVGGKTSEERDDASHKPDRSGEAAFDFATPGKQKLNEDDIPF